MDTGGLLRRYFCHTRVIDINFKGPPWMDNNNMSKNYSCFRIDLNAWCWVLVLFPEEMYCSHIKSKESECSFSGVWGPTLGRTEGEEKWGWIALLCPSALCGSWCLSRSYVLCRMSCVDMWYWTLSQRLDGHRFHTMFLLRILRMIVRELRGFSDHGRYQTVSATPPERTLSGHNCLLT